MNKTTHDYKCCECGKTAVYSLHNTWFLQEILDNGDFVDVDDWSGDTDEMFCDACYEKTHTK